LKDAFSIINGVIVMVLSGERDEETAERTYRAFRERMDETGLRRLFFDARLASTDDQPEHLMKRARSFGEQTPPCQVAILAKDLSSDFSRIYRRALTDTGHDVQIFTDIKEAEAWLSTPAESDRLYLI